MSLQFESIKIFLENTDDLTVSKIGRWCKNYFNEKKARLAKERLRIEQTHTDIISRQCLNVFYIPLLICDVTIRHPSMKFDVFSKLHFKAVLTKISKEEFLEWLTVEMSKKLQTDDVISKTNSYIEIINSYIEIISANLNLDSLLF